MHEFSTFQYNRIYVIQSIPANEIQTGERVFEDSIYYKILQNPELSGEVLNITERSLFFYHLGRIAKRSKALGENPVLHFELHGDEHGIELSDKSYIEWREVADLIREINVVCRNNLFITMAACNGVYLSKIIDAHERSPFWGLFGPDGIIKVREILQHFPRFYELFLANPSADTAFRYLNEQVLTSKSRFILINSEHLFLSAYSEHASRYKTDEEIRANAKRIINSSEKFGSEPRYIRKREIKRVTSDLPTVLRNYYQKTKRHFFMEDLYPENASRFNVTYEEMRDYLDRKNRG